MNSSEILGLIKRINEPNFSDSHVLQWAAPIPSFGDWTRARIATIGINPSDREFVNILGEELNGSERRFHTLSSLSLESWAHATLTHADLVDQSCKEYFQRNPYDGWFKKLDFLLSGADISFYFPSFLACHLDLVPYATEKKWMELTYKERNNLLSKTGFLLGSIIRSSNIEALILNGKSVVENFEKISNVNLSKEEMPTWVLPRRESLGVKGYSFSGTVSSIGTIDLGRPIPVLGYNHNIQSSFGVTSQVLLEIRKWINLKIDDILRHEVQR